MRLRKKVILSILLLLLVVVIYIVYYAWNALPIISGYGSKVLCSCVFVAGRKENEVKKEELGDKPLTLGSFTVNYSDSSVTGNVFGFARQKAIYRRGLGCTLVNDYSESAVRSQVFVLPASPAINTAGIPWPNGNLLSDSLPAGIDTEKLNKAVELPFQEPNEEARIHTRAIVVVYKGQIVGERYAPGFSAGTKMHGWSMAKSINSALVGILVKQGKLVVGDPAPVKEWNDPGDPRHVITTEDLLQQTSGLDFEENYNKPSEATNMLFRRGDAAAFTAKCKLKDKPGSRFYYSSGNSNILSAIVRHSVGEKEYAAFPSTQLFNKIGMNGFVFEPDASGTYVASSYTFGTARDYARFGLLYYNDGVWNGERILPEGWVKKTITAPQGNSQKDYGYQFWLNGADEQNPSRRIIPDAPADLFYADGYGGQRIYIIPSRQLVIVRLGLHKFDENSFLKAVLLSVE